MYAPYFGLTQEPFSIAPDPRYLFMSERHREALAHLLYGLGGGGGFVLLTGEIGAGKTTVCRCFLEQIPAHCDVAYIFNPKLTVTELLQSVCEEFRIAVPRPEGRVATVKDYIDPLNAFLLAAHAQGRNSVLIIDEAQNLSAEVLEQLRLLTNLETSERKLLQIILIGQPELRQLLARPELEQLGQRVIARYHLGPLSREETAHYVRHRLEVAGLARAVPFEPRALERVHAASGGVPRRINLLCDRAMLGAFATGASAVSQRIVKQAAQEVFGAPRRPAVPVWRQPAAVLGLGLALGAGLVLGSRQLLPGGATPVPAVSSQAPAATPAVVRVAAEPAQPPAAPRSDATQATLPAAAPAPEPPAPPSPVLLRDEQQAWRELAAAWKLDAGDGPPCERLAREQVQCYSRNVSLALIRQLDRPGIVTLDRNTGRPSYAVLAALGDDSATLRAAGTEQTVTLAALAARWQGDWATLWRTPPGFSPDQPHRHRAPTLEWVRAQLPTASALAPLRDRLRQFQLAHGLDADGQLGPMTFMQLNRVAGVDEPRLPAQP